MKIRPKLLKLNYKKNSLQTVTLANGSTDDVKQFGL